MGGGYGGPTTARPNPLLALGETEARRGGENHRPPPAGKGKDGASRKRPSWARKASALARRPPPSLPRASAAPPANGKAAARPELDSFLTFTEGHLLAEASQEALGLMGSSCGRVPATGRGPAGAEGALGPPPPPPVGCEQPRPRGSAEGEGREEGKGTGAGPQGGGRGRGRRGWGAGRGSVQGRPSLRKPRARTPPLAASPGPAGICLRGAHSPHPAGRLLHRSGRGPWGRAWRVGVRYDGQRPGRCLQAPTDPASAGGTPGLDISFSKDPGLTG